MKIFEKLLLPIFVLALLAMSPDVAEAQGVCNKNPDHPRCQPDPDPEPDPEPDPVSWLHPDVGVAHEATLNGAGSHMITVDNFSGSTYSGNLVGTTEIRTHGGWTYLQSNLVAPGASREWLDHSTHASTNIRDEIVGLTAVNLSFGLFDPAGTDVHDENYALGRTLWDSIVDEADSGTAVFVKAAGNTNGGTVDGTVRMRLGGFRPVLAQDSLNLLLIGDPSALFVGALDGNGTVENPASIASYSTIAGSNTTVQDMFLVVGVEDGLTGLAGTSFAAPIVTGYAAIVGQKFTDPDTGIAPTAGAVVDQLLDTARTDTISGFDTSCTLTENGACTRSSIYGVGEASLLNAISPISPPG